MKDLIKEYFMPTIGVILIIMLVYGMGKFIIFLGATNFTLIVITLFIIGYYRDLNNLNKR